MSDTWSGASSTNWYTTGNWSTGAVPPVSGTGTEVVVIGSATNTPLISPTLAPSHIFVTQGGVQYEDAQLAGELITLTAGGNLEWQGVAFGTYLGNDTLGNITNLKAAASSTATFDAYTQLDVTGAGNHNLLINDVNHNFGEISISSGATLNVTVASGGNAQTAHGLYNYGLIYIGSGADFTFGTVAGGGGTMVAFYNPGWIEVEGGTFDAKALLGDGANTANAAGTPDGYIEIGHAGDVILSGSVAAQEQITFTDTSANTLQITAGTLFSGTVNNFGPSDTIIVNGFTSTSNATIVTVGGVTELATANGSVVTTITLTGTTSSDITTGTNASGQEYIVSGSTNASSNTTYSGSINTLGSTGGTTTSNGTVAVINNGTLVIDSSLAGTGLIYIDYGSTAALENTTGNDSGQTVQFGTHGSASGFNTLIVNDNSAGFGGTVSGFGAYDKIVLGPNVITEPSAGSGGYLSYNSTSHVLTVEDTNSSTGSIISATTLSISGTAALTTASFVELYTSSGTVIELASNLSGTSFNFSIASGTTGGFETPANFTGGTAPGDSLVAGETVTIASGTASVSSAGVADSGSISVLSGAALLDNGSLSGTGTLNVAAGGSATLGGTASLGAVANSGTLKISGNFTDASALTGTGTLAVLTGGTANLIGGSTQGAILDSGTINISGATTASSINMEGNGANSVVDFTGTSTGTPLTNLGTTDEIILGTAALTAPVAGSSAVYLSYNTASGVLTVEDTNSSSHTLIGSADAVTVSGTAAGALSTASFIALASTKGEIIELVSSLPAQSFNFSIASGTTGGFETPANFTGGVAPGDSLASGETVTLGAGTASVASTGVTDNGSLIVQSGAGLLDNGSLTGTGTLSIAAGGSATLGGSVSLGAILDSGTLDITGTAPVSAINMEGNGANSIVEFSTASAIPSLYSFGTTDQIIISGLTIPTGDGLVLSYNSSTGVLTGAETNSAGTTLYSGTATVTGVTGTSLSTASFIELAGPGGETIELAPTTATGFTFSVSGTGSFEAPASYTGGTAPGDVLSGNETVTIAAGTASVSSGGVTDAGSILVKSGAGFLDAGSLTGTGTLSVLTGGSATLAGASLGAILDSGSLTLTGSLAASSINMEGNNAASLVDFTGTSTATPLTNFGFTDKVIIGGNALHLNALTDNVTESYNTGTGVVTITDHTNGSIASVTLGLTSGDPAADLKLSLSAAGVTMTLCFYPGTAIATPGGETLVENLAAGDLVLTANGAKPVRWIGQSHIHTSFADPLRSLPIRIRKGALGNSLPARDLLLSPDHAIQIEDILIQASALVNGTSITREHNVPEQFTYYHVELDSHELLSAEGVAAESFVDNVDRMNFHNWDHRTTPTTPIPEMDLPRAKSARQIPANIRHQLGINTAAVA